MNYATPRDGHALLSGKYRLGPVLGRGGMGLVREAEHLARRERVAVKLLRRDKAHIEEVRARFLREAWSLHRIRDAHVVAVLDLGETSDGRPYFVMELLEGVCLATLSKRGSLESVGAVADLVRQACLGLAAAHRVGIIHRDVKPSNIVVTSDERGVARVKLLDFGVASPGDEAAGAGGSGAPTGGAVSGNYDVGDDRESEVLRLTKTNVVMGTPLYMSPEQIRAPREADARSDVFSMGVVLYELFTRRLPWRARSPVDLVLRQMTEIPPPVDTLRPDVPHGLARIVEKCLALEPSDRFGSGAELAAALAPFATPTPAAPFLVDDDEVHTVIRDTYRSSPDSEPPRSLGPAPAARDLSSLFSDHGAPLPMQPAPTLPPAGLSPSGYPPGVAPVSSRRGHGTQSTTASSRRAHGRISRRSIVALMLIATLLPPAVVLFLRYVGPHIVQLAPRRALSSPRR